MRVMGAGVTLLELLVVLVILGVIVGISGLALTTLRTPREAAVLRTLRRGRAEAIRSGHPVRVRTDSVPTGDLERSVVLFLPDGRAVGPGVDPLTGAPTHASR
jgi:prepilin-type N-terminal cleavage/methylation domain-containing protein